MDDIKIIVGKRIQERRTELRMTQEELAKKVGYKSRSAIAKIETGNSDLPQTKVIDIAKALDTTPAYIMGWTRTEAEIDADMELLARIDKDEEFKRMASYITRQWRC